MILILTGHYDHSTDMAINWLHFHNAKFVRVNDADVFLKNKIEYNISNQHVNFSLDIGIDLSKVWYKKFGVLMESSVYRFSKKNWMGSY